MLFEIPDILHRLYLGVLWLIRPRLGVGQQRLEWQCNCGMRLYSDFHGDDEEIDKIVMDIQSHGFLVTQSGHGAKQLPAGSIQTTASNSQSLALPRSDASETARSSSINISSIPKDTHIFHNFKRAYEACRSSRINVLRSWLTKPVDIDYIQFAVEGLKRVYLIADSPDCAICAHMENKDDLVVTRRYECHPAASALAHPPIPSDLFFHLWECPGDITPALQTMWLNHLPKKLDEKLEKVCLGTRPNGEIILGWGILVIEGIHKRRISRLTAAMAALAMVISIAYSARKKDVSSDFATGALVIAY